MLCVAFIDKKVKYGHNSMLRSENEDFEIFDTYINNDINLRRY